MIFFYIRHGDPTYRPDDLTPLGERQAEALAKRFAVYGLDEIYTSPMVRARKTAGPTCEVLKMEPTVLDWCSEALAFGDVSIEISPGKRKWACGHIPTCEKFLSPEVVALGDKWYTHPAFDGTNFARGVERVERETDALLLSLGYRHDRTRRLYTVEEPSEKRIALFAHSGFGGMFLSSLLDIPYNIFCTRFTFGLSGVTAVHFKNEDGISIPKILQLSNDSHLWREGLGIKFQNTIPL